VGLGVDPSKASERPPEANWLEAEDLALAGQRRVASPAWKNLHPAWRREVANDPAIGIARSRSVMKRERRRIPDRPPVKRLATKRSHLHHHPGQQQSLRSSIPESGEEKVSVN